MEKGSLSVDQIILIVIGMIVLVLAVVFVTNISGQAAKPTIGTAQLYSECSSWRLFGYSSDTFKKDSYPRLFQTYGLSCLDEKGKLKSECESDKTKTDPIARSAKNFCTMKRTCTEADCGTCTDGKTCQPNDDNQCECQ